MLKGTLDDFTLPDIFRLLSQSHKTGRLDVERSAGQGNVFFRDGDVYFAESSLSKELIGQKLVKAKVLSDGQLIKALDEQAESGGRLGEVLRAAGLVDDDQLVAAVTSQIEDAVFDLLRWDAGEFDWAPGETMEAEVSLSVSVENLIMEGSRRLDELAIIVRKIPSENAVVAMAPAPPEGAAEINITPNEWRMLVLVNGDRTVLEIAEAVGADVFATMRTLYGLAAAGLVHVPGFVSEVDDDEPLPELPPEPDAVTEAPAIEAAPAEPSGYDSAAYEPESITSADDAEVSTDDFASEILTPVSDSDADSGADADKIEATDMPTGDWFDAPGPGDLTAETPSEEAEDGEAADPFVSEILAPEFSAESDAAVETAAEPEEALPVETAAEPEDALPVETAAEPEDALPVETAAEPEDALPRAEDLDESFQPSQDVDIPVTSGYEPAAGLADLFGEVEDAGSPHTGDRVDKRAAVQELSELFRQTEVDTNPTFMVPKLPKEEDPEPVEVPVPEARHRVEDDEEITRGLISRLIDGVKGL